MSSPSTSSGREKVGFAFIILVTHEVKVSLEVVQKYSLEIQQLLSNFKVWL